MSTGMSLRPRSAPVVSSGDALLAAVRTAYLHYLTQPRQKRRKFVPMPVKRPSVAVTDLMNELKGGRDSKNFGFKLPHSFHKDLEKRMSQVISGQERMPGFNDAALKRSMANAYNSFTEADFKRGASKDRKIEQYILVFFSKATAACLQADPRGDMYKSTADRHVVMFVRLVISVLKKEHSNDRAELISALQSLENKLQSNSEALYINSTSSSEGVYVEEEVPLSYDVRDMRMVQDVAKIFGKSSNDMQELINSNKTSWTEEEAVKDLKLYLSQLRTNGLGTLSARDFDLDEAFDEWKKAEVEHVTKLLFETVQARPDLNRSAPGPAEENRPSVLQRSSLYGVDKLRPGVDSTDAGSGISGLSLEEGSSIRMVEDSERNESKSVVSYTFIPSHPREYYKAVVQHVVSFELVQCQASVDDFLPLSSMSLDLLTELAVRWRVPQFSRLVVLIEVIAAKYLDGAISDVKQLGTALDFAKEDMPPVKKPPLLSNYNVGLAKLSPSSWTTHDLVAHRDTLQGMHSALRRELYQILMQSYSPAKTPSHKVVCLVLDEHVYGDSVFRQSEDSKVAFQEQLRAGLREAAMSSYSAMLETKVPEQHQDWDFVHVVELGKAVIGLCRTLKKRFSKTQQVQGVNPYRIYVEAVFPSFEDDAYEILKRIFQVSEQKGEPIAVSEAFALYHELNEIVDHHEEVLPGVPFVFDVEELLVDYVHQYITNAEEMVPSIVRRAIEQDNFKVRTRPDVDQSNKERHSSSVIDTFRYLHQVKAGVMNLEWRNAYQVAKFRTALARILAVAIQLYCNELESRFAREMDRPTTQELAAKQQGTSLLKFARDKLSVHEKPEPFQFYEESFVKLNNIEYAMQELDKLEASFEVEQCVRVIEERDGPLQLAQQRNSRANKYVFTIKVMEAEDLKACDASGFSDPYVVLCDEFQKRLLKTRVVNRTLNPQWNESVDINICQPCNIIVTIWDWDSFGDHDFVGRTNLKLDPRYFGDYLPREFWLDLDTQGRILLRVSMEGERDDIQFYFGKAFRTLKRAERDMVRKVTDKLVAEIKATISRDTLGQLLNRGIGASISSFLTKRQSIAAPPVSSDEMAAVLQPLLDYFDANFSIMKQTLADLTMLAVMSRLWKEVLMAIESLLVPPLSDKPSSQKALSQRELDIVFFWKEKLYQFFNVRDRETGEVLGVPETVLKNSKWHDLGSAYYFYHEPTNQLIAESERMAAAAQQREQAAISGIAGSRHTAPASLMVPSSAGIPTSSSSSLSPGFASMGTIRRGKSIAMSRNLGTMRRHKEEKRKEAQAEPSDDMILRILRMRDDSAQYLKHRSRQRERMQAVSAAAMIVRNSMLQGLVGGAPMAQHQSQRPGATSSGAGSGAGPAGDYGRGLVPRR